jgi:LysR family nitrogen assimilation transcriptional regulator
MDLLRSSISLRQLHYLVAVADAGSFSAGADRTHVAQPALSRQVALLEAQVGQRLFTRSRTGVTLTEGGVRLYNLARNTLEQIGGVQRELQGSPKRLAGVVTIALPPSVASMLVPQLLRELDSRYPGIVLRIEDGLSLANRHSLEAALIDFGIVPTADELVDVDYEPLVRESLLLVETPAGTRRAAATIAFDQVATRKLVLPPRSFHTRRVIDDAALRSHLTLNIAYEQRSITTIMSMVRAGLAATITNSPAVEQFWAPGAVAARRIVRPELARVISLARPSKRTLTAAAKAVYEVVRRLAIETVKSGRWQGMPMA